MRTRPPFFGGHFMATVWDLLRGRADRFPADSPHADAIRAIADELQQPTPGADRIAMADRAEALGCYNSAAILRGSK